MKIPTLSAVVLLATVFILASTQVVRRQSAHTDSDTVVIRMGHWLLHAGMREGLESVIADYQRIHPKVRIEQNTVPLKTWFSWQRAQWTGGNTPDLMQLGKGTADLELSRYYLPLSRWVDQPNPYNEGSSLEGVPWRDTFIDGLTSWGVNFPALGGVYGIPAQVNTTRLYYNRDLLKKITGHDTPPASLEELLALGQKARAYSAENGHRLVPLSICGPYAEALLDQVFSSMTQTLALDFSTGHTLRGDTAALATGWLDQRWSFEEPRARRALQLWAEIASLAQPGYLQLQREDAHFTFVTGNAVLLFAGSWDYASITGESGFPVGVLRFPFPQAGNGYYGQFTLGAPSEAEGGMEAVMGVARDSKHPEVAIDFLRFLSSHTAARKLLEQSQRISAVRDIPVPPDLERMTPDTHGAIRGLGLGFRGLAGGNAALVFNQNLYLLTRQADGRDGVALFIAAVSSRLPEALQRDLSQTTSARQRMVRMTDTRLIFAASTSNSDSEINALFESTVDQEFSLNQLRARTKATP